MSDEPTGQDPGEDRERLNAAESGGNTEQGHYDKAFNSAGHKEGAGDGGGKADGADKLNDSEKAAGAASGIAGKLGGGPGEPGKSWYSGGGDSKAAGKMRGFRARLNTDDKFRKKVLGLGVGLGGASGVVMAIIILFFIISLFKIPDLGQNILEFQFARLTRQYRDSAMSVTEDALGEEAADDASYSAWRTKWENAKGTVGDTWRSLDKYRPGQVLGNLKSQETDPLKFRYSQPNYLGRQQLTGVELGGDTYDIAQQGFTKYIPGVNKVINFKNQYQFVQEFQPALDVGLRASEAGPIVRGIAENNLRKELGISLYAWLLGRFNGKSGTAAEAEAGREQAEDIDNEADTIGDDSVTSGISEGVQETEAAQEDAVKNSTDAQMVAALDNGGIFQTVRQAIADAMQKTGISAVGNFITGLINPIYGPAIAICTVYDGSLERSNGTIDKQTTQEQSAFYFIESAGDQEKAGDQSPNDWGELDAAVGGTNDILSDTTKSNPYMRANNQNIDTTKQASAEAGAGGEYTLLNATLGSLGIPGIGAIVDVINSFADKVCPVATNGWAALGIGIGNLILGFLSGGTTDAAEEAAGNAAEDVVTYEAKGLIENLVTKYIGETAGRITGLVVNVGKDTIKTGIKIAAITVFAKFIVAMRAGQAFAGTSTDADLANEADAGGNINANEMERTILFGRPMTESEVCQSDATDRKFVLGQINSESGYERYLDPANADSLVSHTAFDLDGDLSNGVGSALTSFGNTLFQPYMSLKYVASMFTGLASAAAPEDCNANANDYGDVQFGWSQAEENLYDSDASYEPMNNAVILDESGQQYAIAAKYAACFGYTYSASGDGSLDPLDSTGDLQLADGPNDAASLGAILSATANGDSPEYIGRDSNGNVLPDEGLCSPDNLGYNSSDPLAADSDPTSPQKNDMIYRWRLALNYEATLSAQMNEQTVTPNP